VKHPPKIDSSFLWDCKVGRIYGYEFFGYPGNGPDAALATYHDSGPVIRRSVVIADQSS